VKEVTRHGEKGPKGRRCWQNQVNGWDQSWAL